ncbi:MAG: nucleotidyltransferase domain-containing protein [Armatimonadetes bacterium]|nr:nucleotidyltransferase domain-containing protein [Armatimonadota bacterium]
MAGALRREAYVERLAPAFEGETWIVAAYLFGSHARGEGWVRPWSDVDIGIALAEDAPQGDASPLTRTPPPPRSTGTRGAPCRCRSSGW